MCTSHDIVSVAMATQDSFNFVTLEMDTLVLYMCVMCMSMNTHQ